MNVITTKNKETIRQLQIAIHNINKDMNALQSYIHSKGETISIPEWIVDYYNVDIPVLKKSRRQYAIDQANDMFYEDIIDDMCSEFDYDDYY